MWENMFMFCHQRPHVPHNLSCPLLGFRTSLWKTLVHNGNNQCQTWGINWLHKATCEEEPNAKNIVTTLVVISPLGEPRYREISLNANASKAMLWASIGTTSVLGTIYVYLQYKRRGTKDRPSAVIKERFLEMCSKIWKMSFGLEWRIGFSFFLICLSIGVLCTCNWEFGKIELTKSPLQISLTGQSLRHWAIAPTCGLSTSSRTPSLT